MRHLLTTQDAARFLRKSIYWVRDQMRRGELPGYRVGREWRFVQEELEAWVLQQPLNHGRRKEA